MDWNKYIKLVAGQGLRNQDRSAGSDANSLKCSRDCQSGFTLLETAVALVVILIGVLGAFMTIAYAISYNTGNNSRAQSLAVLQKEVEALRSAKFTPNCGGRPSCVSGADAYPITDTGTVPKCNTNGTRDLTGGKKRACTVDDVDESGTVKGVYLVETAIDDDPTDSDRCRLDGNDPCTPKPTANFKEITVRVSAAASRPGWETAVPTTVVLRRVRSN